MDHQVQVPRRPDHSVETIEHNAARCGLQIRDDFAFGAHYAETLRLWRERFIRHADPLDKLGFDETFRRTWELYLAYSQAGFTSGCLDVLQLILDQRRQAPCDTSQRRRHAARSVASTPRRCAPPLDLRQSGHATGSE
jgi:hypothetical protein